MELCASFGEIGLRGCCDANGLASRPGDAESDAAPVQRRAGAARRRPGLRAHV